MIHLLTLGASSIRQNGTELTGIAAHRQKLALISYLAVEGSVSRDHLLLLLWPGREESKARHALSQALHALRKDFGEHVVRVVGDRVALDPDTVEVDLREMEAAAEEERWEEVVELYAGPFLDQFHLPGSPGFEEWQTRTRAWVGAMGRRAFSEVIRARFAKRDKKGALQIAMRWAKQEPLEDEAQHALIALLAASGNRSDALAQYEAFRNRLQLELQVEPLDATVDLIDAIRSGSLPSSPLLQEFAAPDPQTPREEPRPVEPAPIPVVAGDLDELVREELKPRLEIVRKLSESSTATVYLAKEKVPIRMVAVKVFSPKLATDRRAQVRFEREVQAIASLSHPNIVTLLWAGALSNGLPYFIMEYVEGTSLAEKLKAEGRLPIAEARRILTCVARALGAAHRRGLVHRDVQPENVLYDEEEGCSLLADFGIVGMLAGTEGRPVKITESGELVGDPEWMSPEQARDLQVTERSDIYNLGLLGYHLLAGRGPYEAETRQQLYAAIVKEKPRALIDLRPDVDPDLAALLERCLAKEPRHRPSARRVAETLSGEGPGLAGGGLIGRLLRRRVLHWVGAYMAGGYLLVELALLLRDERILGEFVSKIVIDIVLISYLSGAPIVFVLAWYHGRTGRQQVERRESLLLAIALIIWLTLLLIRAF